MSVDWLQQAGLVPSDPEVNARFGSSVAIYGDTVVVSAPRKNTSVINSGSVYIFIKSGSSWVQQAELVPSDPEIDEFFGGSVAIYGDTVVVGAFFKDAPLTDSGKAYIFTRSGTTWSQQASLVPSDPEASAYFGNSVSIYGDTVVVGAFSKDSSLADPGKAYIFTRSGTTWSQQASLVPSDPQAGAYFGSSVSIYGDTVVVGAFLKDTTEVYSGKAYIFTRSGITWTQQAELVPSDPEEDAEFGYSVSIYGDTVVVGAYLKNAPLTDSGKAYVFVRNGTTWSQQAELVPSDPEDGAEFGYSVAIYGDTVVVGALLQDTSVLNSGTSYIFTRSGTTWSQQAELFPSDPEAGAQFGNSVSIYGDTIIIGAIFRDAFEINSGKAYIFVQEFIGGETLFSQIQQCLCSEKLCAQDSYTGITETSKVTHVVDNRTVATSYNLNNIPYNVRGRSFPTYQDYLKYLQASLKYN